MRVILKDGSTLTTMDQVASAYFVAHAAAADLDVIKVAIKKNNHFAWFSKAISVESEDRKSLDKTLALKLFEELGATPEQIAACYRESHYLKVSSAK